MTGGTMFEKIWQRHVIGVEEGEVLLYVDRALIHEGSSHAFAALQRGIQLIDPSRALAWMSREEFDTIRESSDFKKLVDQLEIASVSLDNPQ